MKTYPNIDYQQRPASYWTDDEVLAALLRNVKGRQRRRMITDYWKAGRIEDLAGELLQDTVSEATRDRLGQIHPSFMGGEYLPDYEAAETEIARIDLDSTLSDVISIRAQPDPEEGIRYRIVDEYETEFELHRETSAQPLTLAELIEFIDKSNDPGCRGGLSLVFNEMNADGRLRAEVRHFTTISSLLYPRLADHYEQVFDDWVADEPLPEKVKSEGMCAERSRRRCTGREGR